MNEKIRELMMKATKDMPETYYWPGQYVEKFAELIVRECIQVCADRGTHHDGLYSAWAVDCSERIGKHFGVKE